MARTTTDKPTPLTAEAVSAAEDIALLKAELGQLYKLLDDASQRLLKHAGPDRVVTTPTGDRVVIQDQFKDGQTKAFKTTCIERYATVVTPAGR